MNEEKWTIRPWGKFKVIDSDLDFVVKHLIVFPKGKTSIQSHVGREEFWTVSSGTATVVFGNSLTELEKKILNVGDSFHVPFGKIHRIENNSDKDVHIIEIWKGNHLSESDIIRYEDIYGRV